MIVRSVKMEHCTQSIQEKRNQQLYQSEDLILESSQKLVVHRNAQLKKTVRVYLLIKMGASCMRMSIVIHTASSMILVLMEYQSRTEI